jgi:hypothetical protein
VRDCGDRVRNGTARALDRPDQPRGRSDLCASLLITRASVVNTPIRVLITLSGAVTACGSAEHENQALGSPNEPS